MRFNGLLGKFATEIETSNISREEIIEDLKYFDKILTKQENANFDRFKFYRSRERVLANALLMVLPKKFYQRDLRTRHGKPMIPNILKMIAKRGLNSGNVK